MNYCRTLQDIEGRSISLEISYEASPQQQNILNFCYFDQGTGIQEAILQNLREKDLNSKLLFD